MYAWMGNILRVNLSSGEIAVDRDYQYKERFLGGKGLGQWIIFNEVSPHTGALDPENKIVFSTGPLTGTLAPGSCRLSIDSKNVLTGGVSSSNAGGHFAPELKYAGYDALIVEGRANCPVVLVINNDSIKIDEAAPIWGKYVGATENILREKYGENVKISCIGPAGENLVASSCIMIDKARAAARGGIGAVMGSKNLKAIVVKGSRPVRIAHPDKFLKVCEDAYKKINDNPATRLFRDLGPLGITPNANRMCRLPFRNFQDDHWDEEKVNKFLPAYIKAKHLKKKVGCFACSQYCSGIYESNTPSGEVVCEAIELNHIWDFASKMDMDEPEALFEISALCDELGLDIDNSSGVLSWAFEAYEKGFISTSDTDGLDLKWGDPQSILIMLKKLAYREGFGNLLAEGSRKAAQYLNNGSGALVVDVKGQELAEAVRSLKGWGLGTIVAPRGGGHLEGAATTELQGISEEISRLYFNTDFAGKPTEYTDKPKVVFWYECFTAMLNALGICVFASVWLDMALLNYEDFKNLLQTATGCDITVHDLQAIGRRIHNIEKAINTLHRRFQRIDDFPPKRLMDEPIRSGPFMGERLPAEKWNEMLDEYYELHGWDVETSWQKASILKKLRLDEVAEKLKRSGTLK